MRIVNDSKHAIVAFYGANVGVRDWRESLLGDDTLQPGASVVLDFEDGSGYCRYRFRAVFDDGVELRAPERQRLRGRHLPLHGLSASLSARPHHPHGEVRAKRASSHEGSRCQARGIRSFEALLRNAPQDDGSEGGGSGYCGSSGPVARRGLRLSPASFTIISSPIFSDVT